MIKLTVNREGETYEVSQHGIMLIQDDNDADGFFRASVWTSLMTGHKDNMPRSLAFKTKESRDEILAMMKAELDNNQLEASIKHLSLQKQAQEVLMETWLTKMGVPHEHI